MIVTIDGLDGSGKTTCAKALCELTGMQYVKIKKGCLLDYSELRSELETAKRIIEEINLGIEGRDNIILDRGFLSAIITGKIYCPSLNMEMLLNSIPRITPNSSRGVIITIQKDIAIMRSEGKITEQDKRIFSSEYEEHQALLVSLGLRQGYYIFPNDTDKSTKHLGRSLLALWS